jgi:hypothetical protein
MIMRKICKECANYDHKNLKHTKACGTCVTEHYQDGTESDPSNWRALPQTNADRIRAMSDEELAVFLEYFGCCHYCSEHERLSDNPLLRNERCDEKCEEHCLEWLQRPAEVE